MKRQLILGMGAGQCGTLLLKQILERQPNTRITHEQPPFLSWRRESGAPGVRERLQRIVDTRRERFVGDVASFYLPYVEEAIQFDPDIRIVCLQRPQDEVVAGFCRQLDRSSPYSLNHWTDHPAEGWTHDFLWTRVFPKYDTQDRAEGIARYWEEYYQRVEQLLLKYPDNLRLWDTDVLTTEDGVREMLTFVGVPQGDQVVITGQRPAEPPNAAHLRSEPRGPRYPHPLDPRKCVILVPFQGFIHQECDDALKELERRGYQVRRVAGYAAIDQGRNQLATDALIEGFEETLWIDSDVGFHPDAVDQLRAHKNPMVCGIYPQKGKRALACHVMPGQPSMTFGKRGGLIEMLYAGTGFLLIRREVYLTVMEQLKLPVCNERFGRPTIPFFLPMVRQIEEGHWYLAEDYAFCERARQCGFRIFADSSIRLWHIGYYRYGWEDAGLERQRFGTFTLNFGDMPGGSHDTQTERPKALEMFAEEYPWPANKPEPPPLPRRDWLFPETQEMLKHTVPNNARVIVELGSWTGQSTRYLAGLAPKATVIAIDHWEGSPEHVDDEEFAPHLDNLYESFLAESWSYRDQIIPVRARSVEGLERVAETGLPVDVIHINADRRYEAVKQDLTTALDLFPKARIAGDHFNGEGVRQAVEEVAGQRGLRFEAHGPGWRILPAEAPPPPPHSSARRRPTPAAEGV